MESLLKLFPDNLVAVAIHSDFLGAPLDANDVDFRNEDAEAIKAHLGAWTKKPEAAINRKKFDNQMNIRLPVNESQWINFIQEELESFADIHLEIESNFDESTRDLVIDVSATAQKDLAGDYRIVVGISESGIVAKQLDGPNIIDDYVHNHALKEIITDVAGDQFFSTLNSSQTKSAQFSFRLPDLEGEWVAENCSVFAYVTNGATKEVLQAAEVHVVE